MTNADVVRFGVDGEGEDGGGAGGKVRDSLANLVSGASRGTVREVRDVGVGRIGSGSEAGVPEESGEERRGHGEVWLHLTPCQGQSHSSTNSGLFGEGRIL